MATLRTLDLNGIESKIIPDKNIRKIIPKWDYFHNGI